MRALEPYCVFILTHGRPEKVKTFNTLAKSGFGERPLFIVIDDEDAKGDEYRAKFGERVLTFSKQEQAEKVDEFDNFEDRRAILYARNACFDLAEMLGYEWFVELDDDYQSFHYRMNHRFEHPADMPTIKRTLGEVFDATMRFYQSVPAASIAFSQGGDWVGGSENRDPVKRKAMNSFFLSTRRRFQFIGRINEDVNAYTLLQSCGLLFFQTPIIQLVQTTTQKSAGGMSELYLATGTYVKSFYTVMCSPSCVTIEMMGKTQRRLHHRINWPTAVPCILERKHVKP